MGIYTLSSNHRRNNHLWTRNNIPSRSILFLDQRRINNCLLTSHKHYFSNHQHRCYSNHQSYWMRLINNHRQRSHRKHSRCLDNTTSLRYTISHIFLLSLPNRIRCRLYRNSPNRCNNSQCCFRIFNCRNRPRINNHPMGLLFMCFHICFHSNNGHRPNWSRNMRHSYHRMLCLCHIYNMYDSLSWLHSLFSWCRNSLFSHRNSLYWRMRCRIKLISKRIMHHRITNHRLLDL